MPVVGHAGESIQATLTPVPGVPPARYAYLGPEGTFTEQALRTLPAAAKADLQPCSTVTVALDAVRSGEADGAVVPIENSVEGSVPVTLDELATGEPLMITREMTVPIAFSLLAPHGVRPDDVRRVATHPHAAAQTRRWCALHLPRGRGRAHHRRPRTRRSCSPSPTRAGTRRSPRRSRPSTTGSPTLATGIGDNPGRADPLRAGLAARARRRRRPAATRPRSSRSCARTTRARCWRSSTSSPCAG